jgi:integrase
MSIYQRGENWYIDFTFKGQRIRESIGPSRKGAEKVIAKKKAEIAENKYLDKRKEPDPITFHDFAKEYLQWSKANKKASTYVRDLSTVRTLDEEFGSKNIQDITTWQIEKYKAARKEKLKPASVNREMAVLKHIFSKAIEWGKIKENPSRKVKKLWGEVKRVRFLMPDQVQTLLSNCQDRIKGVVTVAVHTGMRRGEILGLKRDQINLERGIISLFDTKNHERRDIPINETVKATLRGVESDHEFVFYDCSRCILQDLFHEALEISGITDFRFHDLRHTFASN